MTDDVVARARKKVQKAMELADDERKRALLRRRIELAHQGVAHYEGKRIGEAVKCFLSYLKILEDWKGVADGALTPQLFDTKKELRELLLISAVYWDLAKLFDRTQSEGKRREFLHYLDKYVMFSKGMTFQPLCAETMRKYIANNKPVHKEEFRNAYKVLADSKCFVATALVDVTNDETLERLRRFRDDSLSRSLGGRAFIAAYYKIGPTLAAFTDRLPNALRRVCGSALDSLSQRF